MVSPSTALNALNLNQEMTDFNYKKYSLENLENWLYDALSSAEATPQEIYDVIKNVVDEQYHHHKLQTSRCYELLALLNGEGKGHIQAYDDMIASGYTMTGDGFWIGEDKVVKWQLPVQQKIEEGIDDYYVQFPDDLLEAANLKEGDQVEWIDRGDGSFEMRKMHGIK